MAKKTVLMVLLVAENWANQSAWAGIVRPSWQVVSGTPVAVFRVPTVALKHPYDGKILASSARGAARNVRKWLASIGATEVKR